MQNKNNLKVSVLFPQIVSLLIEKSIMGAYSKFLLDQCAGVVILIHFTCSH